MKYNLHKPCDNCPFRPSVRFPLPRERRAEIAASLMSDAPFSCHKTTQDDDTSTHSHCAGALIVMWISGQQWANFAHRLGAMFAGFDDSNLDLESPVYRSLEDFIEDGF